MIDLAIQIADALEATHSAGITASANLFRLSPAWEMQRVDSFDA